MFACNLHSSSTTIDSFTHAVSPYMLYTGQALYRAIYPRPPNRTPIHLPLPKQYQVALSQHLNKKAPPLLRSVPKSHIVDAYRPTKFPSVPPTTRYLV